MIDEAAAIEIEGRIHEAVASGARVLAGGVRQGAQIEPCVLDRVRPEMTVVARETFGPVAPILRVRDADEAIELANATPYGLSSGVVTGDLELALRCARELALRQRQHRRGPRLPHRADAVRGHRRLGPRGQGGRARDDPRAHGGEARQLPLVTGSSASCAPCSASRSRARSTR